MNSPNSPSISSTPRQNQSKSKPWRPLTASCCSVEDQTILGRLSRPCRPSRSADVSKNIAPMPSFRRLSFSDLSRSSSVRINEDLVQNFGGELYDFQLSELRAITQNFSSNYLLGEGGFGTVHKGYVDENLRQGLKAQAVAVKLLDIEGLQGHREWLRWQYSPQDGVPSVPWGSAPNGQEWETKFRDGDGDINDLSSPKISRVGMGKARTPVPLSRLRSNIYMAEVSPLVPRVGFCIDLGFVDRGISLAFPEWADYLRIVPLAEVIFLGQLRHPNLVKLIGYCCEDEERLLVYEFMPRGSLENHLFKRLSVSLPWGTRLKIAIGAAKGLAFLHGADNPVIYRDFKTSNVLLDSDFTAKLSDFGLAKMGPEGSETHVTTRVMGTYGYAAPEYVSTGHLTTKSDVYSFGVVLLELLTGRRAMDKTRPKTEQYLVDWAKPYLTSRRRLRCIMDPRLAGQYSVKGAKEMALLALQCISMIPKDRPMMPTIIETLESLQNFKDMAVTCGQWPVSPRSTRNAVSAKVKVEVRGGNFRKSSPIFTPSRKT
ncbi:hypothetical protein TIFTF001_017179 [Ficus carica]|uniref:Protein kinase domain-containing protein n=1 Tax=Ficus carica TaxID=3494 RepID=A0AA88D9F6_FICCA|nr:hypothetical protein TIFTF001_017179 [Ficus carica]